MKDIVAEEDYLKILELQTELNGELRKCFIENMSKGREDLGSLLIAKIEAIVEDLNRRGHNFGRCDYSGDINYENSEQTFSDGNQMGCGTVLHFCGFGVLATWEGRDKYGG